MNGIFKVLAGFLRFYFTTAFFSLLSIIILYASADTIHYIGTGESLLLTIFNQSSTLTDAEVSEIVFYFVKTGAESIPGYTVYDKIFGVALEGVGGDFFSFIGAITDSSKTVAEPFLDSILTSDSLRNAAVGTLAAIVILGLMDIKEKLCGGSFITMLAFAFAMIFWLLAAYTFGEAVTLGLETLVSGDNKSLLYVIIIVTAVGLKVSIDAFGKKCSVFRLLIICCLEALINLVRSAFAWLMCASIIMFSLNGVSTWFIASIVMVGLSVLEFKLAKAAKSA